MDPPSASKPRKGLRKLMDRLTVSRSRSRSRSPSHPSQPDPKTLTPSAGLGENSGSNANATSSATLQVPAVAELIDDSNRLTQRDTRRDERSAGADVPTIMVPTISRPSSENPRSITWNTLRTSLRLLHLSSILPALSSAVEVLLSCVDGLETVAKDREDYEELATILTVMSDSLKQHASTAMLSDSMSRLVTRTNASLSALNMMNEQTVNTRLEGLHPVKQAAHDSNLSTEVSRRGCTKDTRTTVLIGLDKWLQNPSSASIYWMNGMAGTGKTTIAYTFCEQVEKRKQLGASFFYTRNSSIPYRSALCKVLGQNPDIGSKHLLKQFEQLLIEPLQQFKAAIPESPLVVIDALDECEDRNGIERTLGILLRYAEQVPLKFLITSRPEPEIYNSMRLHEPSRSVIHLHNIESSLVQADIELYLTEELAFMSPHRNEIEQLATRSGCLFIYAATLVRYILYGKRVANPRQRLQSVLSLTCDSTKKHAEIDALYTAILESALHEAQMEDHETEDVQTVIRAVLFAQQPIDIDTISVLGGLDDSERVLYALQPLRSVIHQSERTGLVSTLHASFPDYLLSHQRSGAFYCDAMQYIQLLAQRCFDTMKSQLRFNICALRSSFVPDDEVEDLEARVKANITPTLGYVCQYWANHLGMSIKSGTLLRMLVEFLSHRLLFWMEVLSLLKMINTGMDMLHKANVWINQIGSPIPEQLSIKLVEDSYAFVTNFAGSAASRSTPHIYISCLPFCSRSNQIYTHYGKRTQGLLELQGSLIEQRSSAAIASWQDTSFQNVKISSDASRCVGGLGNTVVIRSVYNGTTLAGPMFGHTAFVCACAFSFDGSKAASGSKDGTIRVWDSYSGKLVSGPLKYDTSQIKRMGPPPDDSAELVPLPFNSKNNYIRSLVLSPDGTRIAAYFVVSSTVYLLDAQTGTLIRALNDHTYPVHGLAISPDGTIFASASDNVRLWSVRDGTPVGRPYEGHISYPVRCPIFTPDGTRVVSYNREVHIWRLSDGSLVAKFAPDRGVNRLALSPDGKHIASTTYDPYTQNCTIQVWRSDDGTPVSGPNVFIASDSIAALVYNPEGTRFITCTHDGTVAIRPVQGATPSKAISSLYSVSGPQMMFSRDGTYLPDEYVFPEYEIQHLSSLSGRYAITLTKRKDGTRQVIDTTDNSIVLGPELLGTMRYNVSAQFSQDSTKIVTGFVDGTIAVWDLERRVMIAGPFSGHAGRVSHVAISPDISLLASAAGNTRRILHVLDPILDITISANSEIDPLLNPSFDRFGEGWCIQNDGWVTNINLELLFWVPLEFKLAWPSLHTSLIVTERGTVQVPKQVLFLGEPWDSCYNCDNE
ncbi:unnamed protein product [Rhizoctonia solani]|uniref:Nephrocystin 3-like N-terminal domain-containing protein n=1 Tax=Rhizoctonia solani TaxID=456999 RepID=A0A8H3AII3_9AGAM|nr:unnamed protein product [Rhizoctonia solani]